MFTLYTKGGSPAVFHLASSPWRVLPTFQKSVVCIEISAANYSVILCNTPAYPQSQDSTSSILAPQISSLKWPADSCLAESQNWEYLSIPNVCIADWTLSGYKTSSEFVMFIAKTL